MTDVTWPANLVLGAGVQDLTDAFAGTVYVFAAAEDEWGSTERAEALAVYVARLQEQGITVVNAP